MNNKDRKKKGARLERIVVKGDTPSKKNHRNIFYRGGRITNIPGKVYEDWREQSMWQLKEQKVSKCPYDEVRVEISIFPKTRRRADLTNKAESVMDLLVDAGVLEDDNWSIVKEVKIVFGGTDKENPRAEIKIINYEEQS